MSYLNIVEEYRRVTEDIAVIQSCLTSINREIDKLINTYRPNGIKGIDYSIDKVQCSDIKMSIFDNYAQMQELLKEKENTQKELESLYEQRDCLEKVVNELGDVNKRVFILKVKGYTNWQIAETLNYSVRRIEQILSENRKKMKKI